MIFVDEYTSCWYGDGVEWINYGFPMYVDIYFNPESGCGTHYTANYK